MKHIVGVAMTVFLLMWGIGGTGLAGAPGAVERYAWQGNINGKIPVTLWFEIRDGLIAGEIIYDNTKDKKPIRLLGEVEYEYERLVMNEFLPDGQISGFITGAMSGGVFEGTWSAPANTSEKGGKEYPIRLTASDSPVTPFNWDLDPESIGNEYAYSYGKNGGGGLITVRKADNGFIEFRLDAHTGAPAFNLAAVPFDTSAMAKGRLDGNRVLHEEDDNCAFEMLFFNDFMVVRYVNERYCAGWFGLGASVAGLYLKQSGN